VTTALLLLPDLLLIVVGFVVCRYTPLDRKLWDGVERLVYYFLFPVLLFGTIVKSPLGAASAAQLVGVSFVVTVTGVALAYALRGLRWIDPGRHAAAAQTAFRFNSYVALALADRIGGTAGLASMALLVAITVPVANVAAVWPLARAGGASFAREQLRNPLIIGTVAGLLGNLLGLRLPEALQLTMQRIGGAALPLGLMAVGAGLRFGALRVAPALAAALLSIRHLLLPALALGLVLAFALPAEQQRIMVAFAAMPTASSAYVLAVRMSDHGGYVAGLVTASTLLGMASVPGWIALCDALTR
jgi:predicted permease